MPAARRLIAAAVSAALTWVVSLTALLGLFAIDLDRAALAAGIMAVVAALLALGGQRRIAG